MPLMPWLPQYDLGCAPMDHTHKEFVEWINRLAEIPDDQFLDGFDQFLAHTVDHFEQEDRWMEASSFLPIHCHMDEHRRVLQTLQSIRRFVSRGDISIGRKAVAELVDWFTTHAATMDMALAVHMRNVGYAPVPLAA